MTPVPAVIILMIVYMASMIGFTTPHQQAWYLFYTPHFLLLNLLIFFVYQRQWNKALGLFLGSTLIVSGLMESLAVHSETLYGHYSFGASLGPQLGGVPAIMPIYWLLIVGSTAILAAKVCSNNKLGRVLIGTTLSLGLTLLIQQVAARLNFWYLESSLLWHAVLVQGLTIALLQYLFVRWRVSSENVVAGYVYGGLLIFFIGILSFLKP